jgi:di/tricarboxylate transporter
VALGQTATSRAPLPSKTFVALGVLLCVIVAGSFGLVPAEVAAAGGAVLMVLTGVITPRSAARALEPKVLGLLAASIGLGAIVVESGLAKRGDCHKVCVRQERMEPHAFNTREEVFIRASLL